MKIMGPESITKNEENFFKLVEKFQKSRSKMNEEDFKNFLFEIKPSYRNDKNFKDRFDSYFSWYNQEFVQDVIERKKNELDCGIRKMATKADWNIKCYKFRKWIKIKENWSSIENVNITDREVCLNIINKFTTDEGLDPHPYYTMRIQSQNLETIFNDVKEIEKRGGPKSSTKRKLQMMPDVQSDLPGTHPPKLFKEEPVFENQLKETPQLEKSPQVHTTLNTNGQLTEIDLMDARSSPNLLVLNFDQLDISFQSPSKGDSGTSSPRKNMSTTSPAGMGQQSIVSLESFLSKSLELQDDVLSRTSTTERENPSPAKTQKETDVSSINNSSSQLPTMTQAKTPSNERYDSPSASPAKKQPETNIPSNSSSSSHLPAMMQISCESFIEVTSNEHAKDNHTIFWKPKKKRENPCKAYWKENDDTLYHMGILFRKCPGLDYKWICKTQSCQKQFDTQTGYFGGHNKKGIHK